MKRVSLFVAFVSSLVLFSAAPAFAEVEPPVEETVIPGAGAPPTEAAEMPAAEPAPSDAATPAATPSAATPSAATPSAVAPADMAPAETAPAETAQRAQAQQRSPVRRVARAGPNRRDARHCLDLLINTEIIKCAEKYR